MVVHNESGTPLSCDIGPYPLKENARPQTRLRQELQMHSCPSEPGEEAAYADVSGLEYGKALADYGHSALVEVTKWLGCRFACDPPANQVSDVASLLNRHLRNTRWGLTVLVERGCLPNHQACRASRTLNSR